ncbi:CART protein, partial [Polypterus senegalus]
MDSTHIYLLTLVSAALMINSNCQDVELDTRSADYYIKDDSSNEKQLIDALQEVLEKLKNKRISYYEKKIGQLPMVN